MLRRILLPLVSLTLLTLMLVGFAWLTGIVARAIIEAFLNGWGLIPW